MYYIRSEIDLKWEYQVKYKMVGKSMFWKWFGKLDRFNISVVLNEFVIAIQLEVFKTFLFQLEIRQMHRIDRCMRILIKFQFICLWQVTMFKFSFIWKLTYTIYALITLSFSIPILSLSQQFISSIFILMHMLMDYLIFIRELIEKSSSN